MIITAVFFLFLNIKFCLIKTVFFSMSDIVEGKAIRIFLSKAVQEKAVNVLKK